MEKKKKQGCRRAQNTKCQKVDLVRKKKTPCDQKNIFYVTH